MWMLLLPLPIPLPLVFFEKPVLAAPQRFELVVAQEANFFGSALYLTGRCCLE